jgi:hypothetical protein
MTSDRLMLLLCLQVQYPDRLPCIMQSPHPALQSDGSLLNISRTFPFGGSHVYVQDRTMLARKEVGVSANAMCLLAVKFKPQFLVGGRHVDMHDTTTLAWVLF